MLWFKRKKKSSEEKTQIIEEKDLPTLVEELRSWQYTLNRIGSHSRGAVTERDKEILEEKQRKIIQVLPNEFQKEVFNILMKYELNLLEFLDNNWKETLRVAYRNIARYLDPEYPLQFIGKENFPVEGKNFFFWVLIQLKEGDSENRYARLGELIKKGDICGHKISEEDVIRIIAMKVSLTLFGKDYGIQSRVLVDIMCNLERGEQFLRDEILSKI